MSAKKTTINSALVRTLLIILGIIIAALLTWNSRSFLSEGFFKLPFDKLLADHTSAYESGARDPLSEKASRIAGFIYTNLPSLVK